MKFQEKYELQEQITSGAIEVFVCEDTESGLPRLLYLLKADSPAGQLSDRDILQRVRSHGPDPTGIILELGKSEPGFHPYIVTTLPRDPLAVQRWVDAYKSFHRTADGNGDAVEPVFGSPKKVPSSLTPAEPGKDSQEPTRSRLGQVALGAEPVASSPTRMGGDAIPPPDVRQDAASQPRSNVDSAAPVIESVPGNRTAQPASLAMTGAFTKEFLAALDGNQVPKGRDANSAIQRPPASMGGVAPAPPAQSAPPQAPADPNSVTAAFDMPAGAKKSDDTFLTSSIRPEQRLGSDSKGSQTGEFTRFMRGFDVPPTFDSPSKLDTGPQFQRVDDKAPGEFTRIFGGPVSHDAPETDLNSQLNRNPSPEEKEPGPLTRRLMGQSGSLKPVEPKLTGELKSPAASEQPTSSQPREESGTLFPAPSATAGAKQNSPAGDSLDSLPQPMWNKEEPAGATRVFTTPGEARPNRVPAKAGPSEYTRIISGPSYSAPPPSSGGSGGAPASGTNPSLPATPAAMPSAPAFPTLQPPPPPKPAAPPSPAVPAAAMKPGGAPKPVSYWPVVIVLNLLLLAAVALVLYFWLKPH